MTLIKDLILGLKSFFQAHQFIVKFKLWGFVLIPGIINIILIGIVIVLAWHYSNIYSDWVFAKLGINEITIKGAALIKKLFNFLLLFSIRIVILFTYLSVYKYIVLIIMSPLLAYMSEKTEELLTGVTYPFNIAKFLHDILRGIIIAIKNIAVELTLSVLILLLAFVPVINFVSPVILFIIQSYFFGFSMLDYANERKRMSVRSSSQYIYKHKGLAVSNGAVFYFLLLIPFIGILMAPAYSIVAATIGTININEKYHNARQ